MKMRGMPIGYYSKVGVEILKVLGKSFEIRLILVSIEVTKHSGRIVRRI
jgi:hypothetical protein